MIEDPADHPKAYEDGYRQGRQSARKSEDYRPRTAGGEFSRGFEDGYYNRPFTGQKYVIPNRVEHYTTQNYNTYYTYQNNLHLQWLDHHNSSLKPLDQHNQEIHQQVLRQQSEALRLNQQIHRQVLRQQNEALKKFHFPQR